MDGLARVHVSLSCCVEYKYFYTRQVTNFPVVYSITPATGHLSQS